MTSSAIRAAFLVSTVVALGACSGGGDATPAAPTAGTPPAPAAPSAPPPPVTLAAYATPAAPAGGSCSLDVINGGAASTTTVAPGSELSIGGWFADAQNGVPGDASLVLTGSTQSYAGQLPAGGERPDVAAALGSESARMSGFNAQVSLAGVEPGEYSLSVVYPGASASSCALNKSISIGG